MSRPSPLSPIRTFARMVLCSVGFTGLVLVPAFVLWPLFAWWRDADDVPNLILGVICSLIIWLFIAVFHLSKEKLIVPVADAKTFLAQMSVLLDEMGYQVVGQNENTLFTRPRFNAFLFGGGVRVYLDRNRAVLAGPKISVEILRRRLRLVQHLFRVHGVLEGPRKTGEQLLKRIEITLRVKPEQLVDVRTNIVEPLCKTGEVVCDLHLLVTSADGVRESMIEQQVRPWAQKNEIQCEIHKHHSTCQESIQPNSMIMSGMFSRS